VGGDPGSVAFEETWNGPQIVGDPSNKALQIAVAPFSDGRLDVYMVGLDHAILASVAGRPRELAAHGGPQLRAHRHASGGRDRG